MRSTLKTKKRRIYITDLKPLRICTEGLEEWLSAHNIDYEDAKTNGVTIAKLKKINDGYSNQVLKYLKLKGVI